MFLKMDKLNACFSIISYMIKFLQKLKTNKQTNKNKNKKNLFQVPPKVKHLLVILGFWQNKENLLPRQIISWFLATNFGIV